MIFSQTYKAFYLNIKYCESLYTKHFEVCSLLRLCTVTNTLLSIKATILVHNILGLDKVLVQVRFATSTTKLGIWYNKLFIRVASRFAEQLKT